MSVCIMASHQKELPAKMKNLIVRIHNDKRIQEDQWATKKRLAQGLSVNISVSETAQTV